jgi:hypothetical protein
MEDNMERNNDPYAQRLYKELRSGHVFVRIYRNPGIPCLTWAYRVRETNSGRFDDRYHGARQINSHISVVCKTRSYLIWRTITAPFYKLFES